jgi:hypothetical protein
MPHGGNEAFADRVHQRAGNELESVVIAKESNHAHVALQLWHVDVQVHPVDTLDLQGDVVGQHFGHASWYAHFRLRYESDPSGSNATFGGLYLGENSSQFSIVDWSHCCINRSGELPQRAGITSGKDVNGRASAREEAGVDKTASAVWPQPPDVESEPQSLERRRQRQGERTVCTSGRQGKKGMQGKETAGVVPLLSTNLLHELSSRSRPLTRIHLVGLRRSLVSYLG